MINLSQYTGQLIEIGLSAKKTITGKLVEYGADILVVYNGRIFYYIPLIHIIFIRKSDSTENEDFSVAPSPIEKDSKKMTLSKILTNAKGKFVEVYITGNQSVFGYITHIKNDYVAFYSPAFNTIYIPTAHLKWLIPHLDKTPYRVNVEPQFISSSEVISETFEEQLKKLLGEVVTFDLGVTPYKIGMLKNVENNLVELVIGDGQILYLNTMHIKSMH